MLADVFFIESVRRRSAAEEILIPLGTVFLPVPNERQWVGAPIIPAEAYFTPEIQLQPIWQPLVTFLSETFVASGHRVLVGGVERFSNLVALKVSRTFKCP